MANTNMTQNDFSSIKNNLWNNVFKPIAPLKIEIWASTEPINYPERQSGQYKSIQIGERWGKHLFDCAWFKFSGECPSAVSGACFARIDINGELLIVDRHGDPLRGLTNKKSEFARRYGLPGKDVIQLNDDFIRDGRITIWAEAGFNDLFGGVQGDGKVEVAEICLRRDDIWSLYYDFEVLCELLEQFNRNEEWYEHVEATLQLASDFVRDSLAEDNVSKARRVLEPLFHKSPIGSKLTISAIGHSHLDLAWLWPIRETKRKGARTLATVLANLEIYPEYVFGCSQPQLFEWIKTNYPSLYERVKAAVKKGQIELQGKFWVEPDCNLPNGESYIRHVLMGNQFFQSEFGHSPQQCWQPDVFGYNGQLPQILSQTGHDAFMTQKLSWNIVNRFPHHSFRWEGIDGSEILTHMLAEETYNGSASPTSVMKIRNDYAQKDISNHALMVFGIGDGGGGPGQEHLERLRRLRNFQTLPETKVRPAKDFFSDWKNDAEKFPVFSGELYLERHQGTFTTQARTKRYNRLCEIYLREAEWVLTWTALYNNAEYPAERLKSIWKEVLLYQFHDILPGSSIKRVYDECAPRYESILDELRSIINVGYRTLASLCSIEDEEVLFNSLNIPRPEWVLYQGTWKQLVIPPCAWISTKNHGDTLDASLLRATNQSLENENLKIALNANGVITSIINKKNNDELLLDGDQCAQIYMMQDIGDAWDYEAELEIKAVTCYLKRAKTYPKLKCVTSSIKGPSAVVELEFEIGSASVIKQKIVLTSRATKVEFENEVQWNETGHMLRVNFPANIKSDFARFEIPFGSLKRVTHESDSYSKAQFEVPAQQWVDLSQTGRGLAVYNDCKYGFRVKDRSIDMALIRSVPHPSCAVITNDGETSNSLMVKEYTDLGTHLFRFALEPHTGDMDEGSLTHQARIFNHPVQKHLAQNGREPLSLQMESKGPIAISNPNIEVVCFKMAETAKNAWILRLCNLATETQCANLEIQFPFKAIYKVNMLETVMDNAGLDVKEKKYLSWGKHEVKTLLIQL